MKAITLQERDALRASATDLRTLARVLDDAAAADSGELDLTATVTLADLVPTGNLDMLPQAIRDNAPISNADLEEICTRAKFDIKQHSRMNGLVENITTLFRFANSTILPILL